MLVRMVCGVMSVCKVQAVGIRLQINWQCSVRYREGWHGRRCEFACLRIEIDLTGRVSAIRADRTRCAIGIGTTYPILGERLVECSSF